MPDSPTSYEVSPRRTGVGWTALLPLGFVVLALLALAGLPFLTGRDVDESRRAVTRLRPVRGLALDYEDLLRREMSSLESYLLTGDEESRRRHESLRSAEDSLGTSLREAVEEAGLPVLSELADLLTRTASWHVSHADLLTSGLPEQSPEDRLERERAARADVVRAIDDFERRVERSQREAWAALEEALAAQRWITLLLVAIALVATVAVALLALRLRSLGREAERRRGDAVRARRQIDAVLGATGEGVLGMDLQGRFTFLNRAGAELLGYSRREVMGEDVHELVHPVAGDGTPVPREECPILGALREGTRLVLTEEVLRRRDGSLMPVQLAVRPMVDGKLVRGLVVTFTDLTRIRAAEEALHAAVQAREDVMQVVSHDLRNPVGSISVAAGFLLDAEVDAETQRETLRVIQRAAERAGRLISDLLDAARLESGGFPVEPGPVDPARLLEDAAETGEPLAGRKEQTLEIDVEGGLPSVEADRDRVVQALSNLLGNAFKYTPVGGRITLLARRGGSSEVVLGVRDTGPGISEDDRERLFDRFWQGEDQPEVGTGLGLAIVHGIVTAHGGRIWVESRPGEGSAFLFTLPVVGRGSGGDGGGARDGRAPDGGPDG